MVVGSPTYIKEFIRTAENHSVIGGMLYPHKILLSTDCHLELSASELLDDKNTQIYPTLIGFMHWASVIGRIDIYFTVSSLSRFSANPRKYHPTLVLHVIGYLKKFPNRRIVVDSNPLEIDDELRRGNFNPVF